nr:uncharacterized protein LOC104100857 [Nicotiana tomentosiformis]
MVADAAWSKKGKGRRCEGSASRRRRSENLLAKASSQVREISPQCSNYRTIGALPSYTEPNPNVQVNAVTMRNGRVLKEVPKKKKYTTSPEGELVPNPVEENEKESERSEPEVPKYAKYLKDIVENKRRLNEFETVALTKECSARVQIKLPPKLKDPGSFTIPLSLGKQEVGRALCDLRASINLISSSLFKQLGLGSLRPITITLQLADRQCW